MIKEVSKYKNNSVASKKKHIFSRLLDYFLNFVISYMVFILCYSLAGYLPVVNDVVNNLNQVTEKAINYVDTTHLQKKGDNNQLISIEEGAKSYLVNLAKTSAYVNDIKYPVKQEDGTYLDVDVKKEETFINEKLSYALDNVSYYFKNFKKSEPSINNYVYEGTDYKDDIDTLLYLKIMGLDESKFIDASSSKYISKGEGVSKFVILNEENTNYLIKKVAMGESSTVIENITNHVANGYIKAIQYGINEVEQSAAPYLEIVKEFNKGYQNVSLAVILIYLVSYLVGYILFVLLGRLISKRWSTVGQKVLNLAFTDLEECDPHPLRLVTYHLISFILFFSSMIIGLMLMGVIGVTSLEIFPHFPVIALLLGLLTFNIISALMPLFTKNRYDISTFISRLVLKDVNEFDTPVVEVPVIEKENSNG